jgi:purine-binding chemotaxis protein CheW
MNFPERILVFSLDDQRYGLGLDAAERVLAAVEITPLPKAPGIVLGIFDLHGCIIPIINIRRRFGRPAREISPDQQFIIAETSVRRVALVVDSTHGVRDVIEADRIQSDAILRELPYVRGVVRLPDGLVLVHDLETLLDLEEVAALDDALRPLIESAGAR